MDNRGALAIGGMTLVGIGVGFFLLPTSPLFLVASVMTGIGIGLVIAAFMSKGEEDRAETMTEESRRQT